MRRLARGPVVVGDGIRPDGGHEGWVESLRWGGGLPVPSTPGLLVAGAAELPRVRRG